MVSYTFVTLDDPDSTLGTVAVGINDADQISGFIYTPGSFQGFFYDGTSFTTVSDNVFTRSEGINNLGETVGYYYGANGSLGGFTYQDGTYTQLSFPALGINDLGQIVGPDTFSPFGRNGILFDNGNVTLLSVPSASRTYAVGINDFTQVVGTYDTSGGVEHGFLYSNGAYTTIDDPLASYDDPVGVKGTEADGINNSGQIVGTYYDNNGIAHGFIYSGGQYTTIGDWQVLDCFPRASCSFGPGALAHRARHRRVCSR